MKETILVTNKILLSKNWVDLEQYNIEYASLKQCSNPSNVVGIISMLSDPINDITLNKFKNLKVVANYAVGFNNIDIDYCRDNGIAAGNTPGVLTDSTSDLAIALLFAVIREFKVATFNVLNGDWKNWEPLGFLGQNIKGSTVGIIGMGRIGADFARKLHYGWDCKIVYHNRNENKNIDFPAKLVTQDELFTSSDIISLHSPFTPELRHIINAKTLKQMKKNAVLINTARGALIDEDALYDALSEFRIFGCGVDVTDPEPMKKENRLLDLGNFFCVPHIGSATGKSRSEMTDLTVRNILTGLATGKCEFDILN